MGDSNGDKAVAEWQPSVRLPNEEKVQLQTGHALEGSIPSYSSLPPSPKGHLESSHMSLLS